MPIIRLTNLYKTRTVIYQSTNGDPIALEFNKLSESILIYRKGCLVNKVHAGCFYRYDAVDRTILVLPEVAEKIEHIAGIKLNAPNQLN